MWTVLSLGWLDARYIGEAIYTRAKSLGVIVAVAICDARGNLVFFLAMDGVTPAAINIALSKAYTAVQIRRSTKQVCDELAEKGEPARNPALYTDPRITMFPGSVPVVLDSAFVGGVGVSGCGGAKEHDLAEHGIAVWLENQPLQVAAS